MVFGIIGENCSGKSTLAEKIKETLGGEAGLWLVRIRLHTGRTHQIRTQFAARGFPLAGDRKYGIEDGFDRIGLWSCRLEFRHPRTGERLCFTALPPAEGPWLPVGQTLAGLGELL